MRLGSKFSVGFACIALVVLLLALVISYQAVKKSTIQAHIGKLHDLNSHVGQLIATDTAAFPSERFRYTAIRPYPKADLPAGKKVRIQKVFDSTILSEVTRIEVSTVVQTRQAPMEIVSSTRYIQADSQYLTAILMVFAWIFVFLISVSLVLSTVFSMHILTPFYKTLRIISRFRVDQHETPKFDRNSTYEFRKLNEQLARMMQRSTRDYLALKEFNENASHELQTPLAIMQSKIDLLINTPLQNEQLRLLGEMQDQIARLSSVKKALTLLMQLEHYQLKRNAVDLTTYMHTALTVYQDVIELKGWELHTELAEYVTVDIDAHLLQLVVNNLMSNALKHGAGPFIKVALTPTSLVFSNPGAPPAIDTTALIPRFHYREDSGNSMGIGLSLVQKIADLQQFNFTYTFEKGLHNLTLHFF